jgi:hypothetical protein
MMLTELSQLQDLCVLDYGRPGAEIVQQMVKQFWAAMRGQQLQQ